MKYSEQHLTCPALTGPCRERSGHGCWSLRVVDCSKGRGPTTWASGKWGHSGGYAGRPSPHSVSIATRSPLEVHRPASFGDTPSDSSELDALCFSVDTLPESGEASLTGLNPTLRCIPSADSLW